MSEVTVAQLAADVGISVDRLLHQLDEAGIKKSRDKDPVSESEKRKLLGYLRQAHGKQSAGVSGSGRKITLKRKTISELKQPTSSVVRSATTRRAPASGGKTVSVEVRRKRTLVKEDTTEDQKNNLLKEAEEARKALAQQESERQALADIEAARRRAIEELHEKEKSERADKESKQRSQEEAQRQKEETERQRIEEEKRRIAETQATERSVTKRNKGKKAEAEKWEYDDSDTRTGRKELHVADDRRSSKRRKKTRTLDVQRSARIANPASGEHAFQKPTEPVVHSVEVPDTIQVSELAQRMSVKATEVIKTLMNMGMMVTINEVLDQDTAALLVEEMGHKAVFKESNDAESRILEAVEEISGELVIRPPVVTIMGHVDHGKTSLLDYIRATRVAAGEAGGITQHIGAYGVDTDHGRITFLDTPGHAAFSAMRARGAKVTDIVVIVVAADDGVMPQTIEAIQHARVANVPIIIAINKIDRPEANSERVMQELSGQKVVPEEWGGDVQFVKVSAHTGEGIDNLLESILLQSEVLELKAVSGTSARGSIVESSLDKGRGAIATVLVQNGTLKKGDALVCGTEFGRVRVMFNENGIEVDTAGPSAPVVVLGLSGAPNAGDDAIVIQDERLARELAQVRQQKIRNSRLAEQKAAKLNELFSQMGEGQTIQIKLVVKADVQGSVEALRQSLEDISTDEITVKVVAAGVGGINESDANLAAASDAIVIGFNVRADAAARRILEERGLELRYYSVIYEVIDDIKKAASGFLSPDMHEEIIGLAEVRDVFRSSRLGAIAGCMVVDGAVRRSNPIRVLRDKIVIFEGELESLRRFKDDVNEVKAGTECGIGVKSYNDVKVGDEIECFKRIEIQREL